MSSRQRTKQTLVSLGFTGDEIRAVEKLAAKKELREQLAEYAHDAWSGWITYMFSKSEQNKDGSLTIPKWAVERWSRQATSKYCGLPDLEKESDRDEADKIIAITSAAVKP